MRIPVAALILAACAGAQPPLAEDKAAVREKARDLLDKAAQTAGAAQPDIQVIALMDIGTAYRVLDKERSIFVLRSAFATSAAVTEERDVRNRYQSEIVKRLAEVNIAEACAMLRAMAEPGHDGGGGSATKRVVEVLLAKDPPEFDRAVETVNLVPETAEYPFDAVERILEKLPAGDSRRVIAFGNAVSAYRKRPEGTTFPHLLGRQWKRIPRDSVQTAVGLVVNAIAGRADDPNQVDAGFSINEEGAKRANSRKAKELVEMIHVVRELDPKRAAELLAKYPELADAPKPSEDQPKAEPEKADSDSDPSAFAMPLLPMNTSGDLAEMQKEVESYDQAEKKGTEAKGLLETNPSQALSLARELPPRFRASLLAMMADTASAKDEALSRRLLDECAGVLGDLKDAGDRVLPWASIGKTAHKLNNDKLSAEAFQHALDDLVEVYAWDTNPDTLNVALPDTWPSIVGCRMVIWYAVKALGAGAEPLLAAIHTNDLALVAQVEMGRALLEQPRPQWSIQWQHTTTK